MPITRFVALLSLLLFGAPVSAGGPHAPQLDVSFLAQPAPIVQYGSTRLVYEMLINNFSKNSYVIEAIETKASETRSRFTGAALASMIVQLGDSTSKESPVDRAIDAGRSVMIFFPLDLGKRAAPTVIEHSIRVLDDKGEAHDIMRAPLPVSDENPIVVAPPLRGDWIASDSITVRMPPIAERLSSKTGAHGLRSAMRLTGCISDGRWRPHDLERAKGQERQLSATTSQYTASRPVKWSIWPTACRKTCRTQVHSPIGLTSIMPPAIIWSSRSPRIAMCCMPIFGPTPYP
jgi:hypothetical protein